MLQVAVVRVHSTCREAQVCRRPPYLACLAAVAKLLLAAWAAINAAAAAAHYCIALRGAACTLQWCRFGCSGFCPTSTGRALAHRMPLQDHQVDDNSPYGMMSVVM